MAFVRDHEKFWETMKSNCQPVNGEIQIFPALFPLPELKGRLLPRWYDTGTEEGLSAARQNFGGLDNLDKVDEEIYFGDGNAVKYFYDRDMINRRLKRAEALEGLVPRIERSTANFYQYKYVQGMDLSRVKEIDRHFIEMLEFSREHLWKEVRLNSLESITFGSNCRKFYHENSVPNSGIWCDGSELCNQRDACAIAGRIIQGRYRLATFMRRRAVGVSWRFQYDEYYIHRAEILSLHRLEAGLRRQYRVW